VLGQWPGGHQVEVTVTNTGAAPMTSWRVQWESSADQSIVQHWSAVVTSTGTTVSAADAGWNGALKPGARTTFGYLATGAPSTAAPALTCR
jgi:cellulase/cellobiase CelA1